MANALQLRRGTTTQHNSFTGLAGEVTVDTDKETVVVHDGSTAGGFPLARASDLTNFDADTLDGKQLATIESEYQAFANTAAANVVDSAPGTLDTLNELAAALGDDPNFATTVTNSIATKMPLAGGTFTGAITAPSMVLNGDLRLDRGASDAAAVVFGPDYDVQIFGDGTAQTLTFMTGASQRFHVSNTGVSITGSAAFGDNGKALFGAGSDLQIYHDGNNSVIADIGPGALITYASDFIIQQNGSNERMADFAQNGAARLYYDGAVKTTTTATGIDVTGTAVTDGVTVDGTLDIEEVFEKVSTNTTTSGTYSEAVTGGGVYYLTNNQTANRTINFTGVNSALATGQSVTVSVLATQGSTAYYFNAYQVDSSAVTPKWSGGSAPTEGNASGIDVYTFTIIKTANATFTVLASQSQYA